VDVVGFTWKILEGLNLILGLECFSKLRFVGVQPLLAMTDESRKLQMVIPFPFKVIMSL
jgi:hypothetical protein